jgi:hypothetical protein
MKKSLFLTGILSLSSFAFAGSTTPSTKSYEISLDTAVKAGTLQLPAGDYKVKFDGSKAVFTNLKTNKSETTNAKAKVGAKKFAHTAVGSSKQADGARIDSIELGGSATEIDFEY